MALQSLLVPTSIAFAILYTARWYWSNPPEDTGKTIILAGGGVLAGLAWFCVWYFIMRMATKYLSRRSDPDR
jgi:hypothetical protein